MTEHIKTVSSPEMLEAAEKAYDKANHDTVSLRAFC